MPEVVELTTEVDLRRAWPIMRDLRPHLDEDTFVSIVMDSRAGGYRLFALTVDGQPVSVAGVAVLTNLYDLRHLWVYDLVTGPRHRSKGYGETLLRWLEDFGRREGCGRIALSSGVQRKDAHRFYEDRMEYPRVSYVYRKEL